MGELKERYELDNDPVLLSPRQIVSATKLVRNLSAYLDSVKNNPLFIIRESEIEAVILSVDEYRRLLNKNEG